MFQNTIARFGSVVMLSAMLLGISSASAAPLDDRPLSSYTPETTQSLVAYFNNCSGADCVEYDLSSQDSCTEVSNEAATNDVRWYKGLSLEVDQAAKGGNIVAYKIQWGNGTSSGWYIPGVNDIDWKYNTDTGKLRRVWTYFYSHTHSYIICKKAASAF